MTAVQRMPPAALNRLMMVFAPELWPFLRSGVSRPAHPVPAQRGRRLRRKAAAKQLTVVDAISFRDNVDLSAQSGFLAIEFSRKMTGMSDMDQNTMLLLTGIVSILVTIIGVAVAFAIAFFRYSARTDRHFADQYKLQIQIKEDLERSQRQIKADLERSQRQIKAELEGSQRQMMEDLERSQRQMKDDLEGSFFRSFAGLQSQTEGLQGQLNDIAADLGDLLERVARIEGILTGKPANLDDDEHIRTASGDDQDPNPTHPPVPGKDALRLSRLS